jgi:hypothetical protein
MASILDDIADAGAGIVSGIKRGAGGLISTGARALQDVGLDTRAAQEYGQQLAAENPSPVQSLSDFRTNPVSTISNTVGENAPAIGASLTAGKIGQVVGGIGGAVLGRGNPNAIRVGRNIGGVLGSGIADFGMFYGGNRERQDQLGVNSPGAAATAAVGQAGINQLAMLPVRRLVGLQPAATATAGGLRGAISEGLKFGGIGAGSALGQEALSRAQASQPLTGEDTEYGRTAATGGLLGGLMGGVHGAVPERQTARPTFTSLRNARPTKDDMIVGHAVKTPPPVAVEPSRGPLSRAVARGADSGALEGVVNADAVRASLPVFDQPFVPDQAPSPAEAEFRQVEQAPYSGQFGDRTISFQSGKNLKPAERVVEQRAAQQVLSDPQKAIEDYKALPGTDGGRVINTDEAREVFGDYNSGADARSAFSYAVHEPASWIAKEQYAQRLAQPPEEGKDPVVIFTAGGTGSGKTTAVNRISGMADTLSRADTIYDGNLQNFASAKSKIDAALDSGRAASILYVNRDPTEAFVRGTLPRAAREDYGRTVPFDVHADTHIGAAKTLAELADHYKDNPNVEIRVINNNADGTADVGNISDVARVAGMNRDTLISELRNGLEAEREAGKVPDRVYDFYRQGQEGGGQGAVRPQEVQRRGGEDGGGKTGEGEEVGFAPSEVRPSTENPGDVAAATFDSPRVIGDETAPINSLTGGVRMDDPKEQARVADLVSKISGDGGFFSRIVADEDGNVLEGQHRLEAMRQLGAKEVPITRVGDALRGFPADKVREAITGVRPEQATQLATHLADAYRESGGDIAKVKSDYEAPRGYEKQWAQAISALSKSRSSARGSVVDQKAPGDTRDRTTYFHGTDKKFENFELGKGRGGPSKFGLWFSADKDFSGTFGDRIVSAELGVKSPLKISMDTWDAIREKHAKSDRFFKQWRDDLIAHGYDGLYVEPRTQKLGNSYVTDPAIVAAFYPEQVKVTSSEARARAVDESKPVNGNGMAPRAVSDLVSRQTKNWKSGPSVEVVPTNAHLPASIRGSLGNKTVDGAYDGNGKIYLVADQVHSAKDVRRILAHEGYAHYGVKGVLGKDFEPFLQKIKSLRETDQDIRNAYAATEQRYGGLDDAARADEVVAHLAENYSTLKGRAKILVAQFVSAVKNFLRKTLNIQSEMSSKDVLAIIAKAKKAIETEGVPRERAITAARAAAQADPFYSALTRSVMTAKGAPKSADPAAWRQWLDGAQRRGEFKGSEREWMGIDSWLDSKQGNVSRDEIADFVRNNSVKLDETQLGAPAPNRNSKYLLPEVQKAMRDSGGNADDNMLLTLSNDGNAYRALTKKFPELEQDDNWAETVLHDIYGNMLHNETKYGQYTLPGGENYRELLMRLPRQEGVQPYRSSHFDQSNILAHVRMNDRTGPNGERILHLEEIQSDWHQEGRRKGYKGSVSEPKYTAEKVDGKYGGYWIVRDERGREIGNSSAPTEAQAIREYAQSTKADAVPDAPFKKEWPMLAFKRALREAVENGYDKLTWTTGDQQAARYDLSKQVDSIRLRGNDLQFQDNSTGEYSTIAENVSPEKIADYVGKDIADKLNSMEADKYGNKELYGQDLKIGGEGMRAFYDKMLPNEVAKYVKQWGGKVGSEKIPIGPRGGMYDHTIPASVHSIDITPAMRESVMGGQPMFSVVPAPAKSFDGWTRPSADLDRYLTNDARSRLRAYLSVAKQKGDKLRTYLQDYFLPVKRTQEAIERLGGKIVEDSNVYRREELYYGRTGARLEQLEKQHVKPLVESIAKSGVSLDDVELYLYAKFAPERNARIAEINKEMPDGGSGMTNEDAAKIIDDFKKQGVSEKLDAIADQVYALNEVRVKALEDAGLISAEEAKAWREDKHYVPLKGFAEGVEDEAPATRPPVGRGFSVGGKEAWRALGRRSRASDLVANAIAQTDQAIIRAEKNRVAQTLLKLVRDNPNEALWSIDATQRKAGFDKNTGEVVYRHAVEPDAVIAKENGQEYRINIRDQRLLEAIKNMGSAKVGSILRAFGAVNRVFSLMRTTYSPEFVLSNFARDLQTAGVNLGSDFNAKTAIRAVTTNITHAMKAMWGELSDKRVGGEWSRWAQEFSENGGMTHFVNQKTVEQTQARLEGLIKDAQGGGVVEAKKMLGGLLGHVDKINQVVENATRLSAYAEARRAGASIEQAASIAKNITVNFNRKGSAGAAINAMWLFYNASIQGAHRFLSMAKNPRFQAIMGAIGSLGFGLGYYNRYAGGKDDDGQDLWDKIPAWEKERNLIIMNAFGKGNNLKIPMPYTYNLPYLIGQNMADSTFGKQKASTAALNLANSLINAFDPVGSIDLNQDLTTQGVKAATPTVLQPFLDIALNRNYFGSPIAPEQDSNAKVKLPDSENYFKGSTFPGAVALAKELNKLSGGNPVRPGAIDVSPASMQYLFDYLAGGTGSFFSRIGTTVGNAWKGEPTPVNKIPFLRTFLSQPNDNRINDTYYTARDDVNQKIEMAKVSMQPGAFPDATENDRKDMRFGMSLKAPLAAAERTLTDIRRLKTAARSRDDQKQVDALTERERAVMLNFNRAYFRAMDRAQ